MGDFFIQALGEVLHPYTLLLILGGAMFGIIAGGIPGFTIMMGIILLFPFTFSMDPINGLALMISVMVGGFSGGLVASVMLGIPGTPSAIATTYDGHPLAKKGQAGRALGIGIFASFIGSMISAFMLILLGPVIAKFALNFGPWEIAGIVLFALTLVASLAYGKLLKGLISGALGLLIATVGVDSTSFSRFSFDTDVLKGGFALLPVMIGVFAFSQLMESIQAMRENEEVQRKMSDVDEKVKIPYKQILTDMWKNKWNLLRSSLIGGSIGALPAAGGDMANFVSYDQAKKFSKHPEKFGTGVPEGVIAPEASNSAVTGGAFIPTLTLGIPGDATLAVMMGILILHGITPGPRLFEQQPVLVGSIYVTIIVASIMVLLSMLVLINVFAKIARVPQNIIVPLVIMLSAVGSFVLNHNMFDVWVLLIFGILGFVLTKLDVPISPLILGFILADTLESNLSRALTLEPSLTTFVTRPISAVILLLTVASVLFSVFQAKKIKKRLAQAQSEAL